MLRRALVVSALVSGLVAVAVPASATCTTGYVGIDKNTGKPRVELPQCNPPPER